MLQLKDHISQLPPFLREFAQVVGLQEVEILVNSFGGTSLNIPYTKHSKSWHQLKAKLGCALVSKLIDHFAGTRIYIPKCEKIALHYRDRMINEERDQLAKKGFSERSIVSQLALKYHICDRHVWRILKKPMST